MHAVVHDFAAPVVAVSLWQMFAAEYPEAAKWLEDSAASGNNFAASLKASVNKYGGLTPNQMAAVQKNIARTKVQPTAVSADLLYAAFDRATASGLKRPKLRLLDVVVSKAPENGKNPGCLYVKDVSGTYLGKVAGSGFTRSYDCSPDQADTIAALMINPAAVLDAYGRRSGNCGCCDRPLTAAESVVRGIGPVCAKKWGL